MSGMGKSVFHGAEHRKCLICMGKKGLEGHFVPYCKTCNKEQILRKMGACKLLIFLFIYLFIL